jgi:rhodanese-related sulfurtransferase
VRRIDTEDARRLHEDSAQFVEVLPATDFAREHIPGARSMPLPELTPQVVDALDRDRPVVTYCYDHECDLSARAAALLESYGFTDVYDYAPSKTAWLGTGLPAEGWLHDDDRAGALADRDVPTCGSDDRAGSLGAELTVVTNDDRVVLGLVDGRAAILPSIA